MTSGPGHIFTYTLGNENRINNTNKSLHERDFFRWLISRLNYRPQMNYRVVSTLTRENFRLSYVGRRLCEDAIIQALKISYEETAICVRHEQDESDAGKSAQNSNFQKPRPLRSEKSVCTRKHDLHVSTPAIWINLNTTRRILPECNKKRKFVHFIMKFESENFKFEQKH